MTPAQIIERDLGAAGLLDSVWGVRIMDAVEAGGFSDEDVELASCWTTCACGKQDAALMGEYGPHDSQLDELGEDFSIAIFEDNFLEAAQLLVKIEYRSAFLLNEMHSADPID